MNCLAVGNEHAVSGCTDQQSVAVSEQTENLTRIRSRIGPRQCRTTTIDSLDAAAVNREVSCAVELRDRAHAADTVSVAGA